MFFIGAVMLLASGLTANGEKHSLTYIYTAISRTTGLPGIHQFTAMGMLDNRMIDYFDSDAPVKVPKEDWMRERLEADYWKRGTDSRQSKQEWFKVNLNILKDRMRQNDSDIHVLQWMHGCEGESQHGGELQFVAGKDRYSYDGDNFLYFDDKHLDWVATVPAAIDTKKRWDDVPVLKEYTKGYLHNECMQWLNKFVIYSQEKLRTSSQAKPPEVYVFARSSPAETNVILTCWATGFYPKDIELNIKRDGRVLTARDGVKTTGVRPNGDDTFQRMDNIEILKKDKSRYTCHVIHAASMVNKEVDWDHKLPPGTGAIIGGLVGLVLVLVLVGVGVLVLVLVLRKKRSASEKEITVKAKPFVIAAPVVASNGSVVSTPLLTKNGGSKDSVSSSDSGVSSSKQAATPESQSLKSNTDEEV